METSSGFHVVGVQRCISASAFCGYLSYCCLSINWNQPADSPLTSHINKAFSSTRPLLIGYFQKLGLLKYSEEPAWHQQPYRLQSHLNPLSSPSRCSVWNSAICLNHVSKAECIDLRPCDRLIGYLIKWVSQRQNCRLYFLYFWGDPGGVLWGLGCPGSNLIRQYRCTFVKFFGGKLQFIQEQMQFGGWLLLALQTTGQVKSPLKMITKPLTDEKW